MKPTIVVVDGADRRVLDLVEHAASIGGKGCDLVVPGPDDNEVVAHLGLSDDAVFIQPAHNSAWPTHCNGVALAASRWLDDGDRLKIGRIALHVRIAGGEFEVSVIRPPAGRPATPHAAVMAAPETRNAAMIEPVDFTPHAVGATTRRGGFRPRMVSIWALLLLAATAIWIVFSGQTIDVVIEPRPDQMEIDGTWPVVPTDGRFFVHPGTYRVTAELSGHRTLDETLVVNGDSPSSFAFAMEPLPGRLRITTGEITGASILIDSEPAATSPAEIELAMGEYAIVVRARRFAEATYRVEITKPGQELAIDIALVPAWAMVGFSTSPPGARVVVDGQDLGATPLHTELGSGGHSIEYRLAGFDTHRSPVTVVAGNDLELPKIQLNRTAGRIVVDSTPSGASITIDDTFKGVTPLTVRVEPGRMHEITLAKGGFALYTSTVQLAPGERYELRAELTALEGRVRFTSTPPGAEVVIDGESRGRTEIVLDLTEQIHRVELRLEGYLPFTTTVTPMAGAVSLVEAVLESSEVASRLTPIITSPQGVELTLIAGGHFTAGASRRVPGRRANETLLSVEISRPYYLAVREVTNREYRAFAEAHRSGAAGSANLEIDHHPVVRVSWENAARYCNWLSQKEGLTPVYAATGGRMMPARPVPNGYRLPTEAEWVWAARFDGRGGDRKYGWGDDLPIPPQAGNFGDQSADAILDASLPSYNDGHPGTAPSGSFAANPRGLHNMGGNVSEWVQDLYTIYPPTGSTTLVDPMGPEEGEYHVIRGASWMDDNLTELRLSYRDYGDEPRPDVGFRIARSADE